MDRHASAGERGGVATPGGAFPSTGTSASAFLAGRRPVNPASSQVAAGSNPAPTPALPHELLVGIWHDLGVIAGRLGRWDESRGWFEQACRYQPRSAALRYDLALIERAAGRFDAARAHVHDALNLLMRPDLTEPRDPNQRRRLQTALERLRDQLPPPSRPP